MTVDDDLIRRVEISLEAMAEYAHGYADGRKPVNGDHRRFIRSDIERAEDVMGEIERLWGDDDGK